MSVRFAIIDSNALAGLGLKHLLEDMIPMAETDVFTSLAEVNGGEYVHYFVSSRIYFENTAFFRSSPHRAIVLVAGPMQVAGVKTLNVCQSEQALAKDLLRLNHRGHEEHNLTPSHAARQTSGEALSAREIEVAVMIAKGLINKEIADRLHISVTTVITHRKNIKEKLHARSISDIIIHLVMNGLVDIADI